MPANLKLRPAVLAARDKLAVGREKLRRQHARGSPGIQVCARLTDLLDTVLLDLYHDALQEVGSGVESLIAMAPYGGYGRRDVAPFSDVDLMLLHKRGAESRIAPFVRRLTQDIVDAGLDLGFSLRTPTQACSLAMSDATIFTSLVECRYLAGSVQLFSGFMRRFRRLAMRRSQALLARVEDSRDAERQQHGDTIYLLKPNVKRSRGGLRDLQMVRWVGFARYGEAEPESLLRAGVLDDEDRRKLRDAREFLLRLRNELHFHAGKSQDLLDRHEQVRIAELYAYQGDERKLPVERFMRDYIKHTSNVRHTVAHFVESAKTQRGVGPVFAELFSHQMEGDFRISPGKIKATRRGLQKVMSDITEVLRLMQLATRTGTRIDHKTWEAIRESMMAASSMELAPAAIARFLALLDQPSGVGSQLRRLHELRVLERIIPPLAHARHLMQFNEYHKYTVDEHSIRAIECATGFFTRDDTLGRAYRKVKKKWLLHLALLVHDLGKGFVEDHSDVGRRLAAETAEHLGLGERETGILKFLVHRHLVMSHLAQRRDINDDNVVIEFAVDVGSAETLQMLYVLTCADLAAVGPGVLNNWRLDLITQLYRRARAHLAGDANLDVEDQRLRKLRGELRKLAKETYGTGDFDAEGRWWTAQIAALPRSFLVESEPSEVIAQLGDLRELQHDSAAAWGRFLPNRNAMEYTVSAYEQTTPGAFHRLTGALTSKGLEILSAEINTLAEDLIFDRFYVRDTHYADEPPAERTEEICEALVNVLTGPSAPPPTFQKKWASERQQAPEEGRLPTEVRIDNSTSEQYTIIDVFTHDRTGLLYTVSRTIFELGLSVQGAKIGTHLDQVVDVFYVKDNRGKITDERRLAEIRDRLLAAIAALEAVPAA